MRSTFLSPQIVEARGPRRVHKSASPFGPDRHGQVGELAKREGIDRRSVRRLIRLRLLSPRIIEAIAEGRQPPDLTVIGLTRRVDLPLLWIAQEQVLGIR